MTTTLMSLGRVDVDDDFVEIRRLDTRRLSERETRQRRRAVLADIRERYSAAGYEDVNDDDTVGRLSLTAPAGPYNTPARTGVRPVR